MTTMPSLTDKPSQEIAHERRDMPVANRNATLIVGLALLVVVLWLGILMLNLQLKLRRLDREPSVDLGPGRPSPSLRGSKSTKHDGGEVVIEVREVALDKVDQPSRSSTALGIHGL